MNTLTLQDPDSLLGTTLPAGVSLKNIQTMTVNTAGNLGQVTAAATAATPAVKEIDTLTITAVVDTVDSYTVTWGGVSVTTAAVDGTATKAESAALIASAINRDCPLACQQLS